MGMSAGLFPFKTKFSSRQVLPGDRRFQRSTLPCPNTRWRVSCVRNIGRKHPAGRTCRWSSLVSPNLDTQNRNFSSKLPEKFWNWTHWSGTLAGKSWRRPWVWTLDPEMGLSHPVVTGKNFACILVGAVIDTIDGLGDPGRRKPESISILQIVL